MNRNREIIKTGLVGVGGNVLLSGFKFAAGIVANSVSIRADAINNLADALSSVITIVGTKLSEKEPDRKHPFGYGRIEYLTSLFIGIFILYAGLNAARESIRRILHPEPNDYTMEAMVIVAVAILVKVAIGIYTKRKGRELSSSALTASGQDSLDDSIASIGTLIAALVYVTKGISIEAYVGVIISGLIIKTGIETLIETISSILGERVDEEEIAAVKDCIMTFPEVDGVFDLVIHNYGKERLIGSAHIEVPDVLSAGWIDNLQRAITKKVYDETGVELMGLTIYALNSKDTEAKKVRDQIKKIADEHDAVIGMNGFYLDKVDKEIKFNVVTDFDHKDSEALRKEMIRKAQEHFPDHDISVEVKKDYS